MAHRVAIIDGKGLVNTADLSNIAINFLTAGIVESSHYQVTQQVTPDMTVKVATGKAYVFNGTGTEAYHTYLDTNANVTIGANAAGNPRIDAIVIKIDKAASPDDEGENVTTLAAVQGTPAASPVAPDDSAIQTAIGAGNPFLRLANVTVANGAVSISNANISDARVPVTWGLSGGSDGWTPYTAVVPTRQSADDPTFVLRFANTDLSEVLYPGMRIHWTQNATERFAIITAVSFSTHTDVTVYGGTDYNVEDTGTHTISDFAYSTAKAPARFPLDPAKWTVRVTDTTDRSQAAAAQNTWYNLGTTNSQISIPIGLWNVSYQVVLHQDAAAAVGLFVTLSTANNSDSDGELRANFNSGGSFNGGSVFRRKTLSLAAKTLHYLNMMTTNAGSPTIYFRNGTSGAPMILEARCAYL